MSARSPRLSPWHWRPLCVAFFFIALTGLTFTNHLPAWVILVHGVMSAISFLDYGWDKRLAVRQAWRTPESFLLFIDLLTGWPGGLLGQYVWRHKHVKLSYQMRFFGVVAINLIALAVVIYHRSTVTQ